MPARRPGLPAPARLPPPKVEDEESDYDDVSDIGEEAAAAVREEKARNSCCGGWCGCDNTKTIDEFLFDITLRPLLNFLLGYFSQPTSFHLVVYFGGGCLAYRYLEGWTYTEAAYFLTVTATTVGYGDFCPVTPLGRAFTCVYCLYGISTVLAALTPLIGILHGEWREHLLKLLGSTDEVDTEDTKLSIAEANRRIDYSRRYALALLSPVTVLFAGVAFHYFAIREPVPPDAAGVIYNGMFYIDLFGLLDSLYYAVITMTVRRAREFVLALLLERRADCLLSVWPMRRVRTSRAQTVGYGDIYPATEATQWFAIVYLPFAVIALADAVADVGMIGLRRSIRETDYGKVADESLLRDAVRTLPEEGDEAETAEPNFQPCLTEAEFVLDQLLANGLVDTEAVTCIQRQFAHLTRNGKFQPGEEPMLTTRLVYEEIRERALRGMDGLLSPGAEALDLVLSGKTGTNTFKWGSYEEWMVNSWKMRVLARASAHKDQLKGVQAPPPLAMRALNTASFRFMA